MALQERGICYIVSSLVGQRGCSSAGRAQPCQGWGRRFESGHPLPLSVSCGHFLIHRRHSQVVRQRSAKPPSPVQIRVPPFTPSADSFFPFPQILVCVLCRGGGMGRHNGLKIRWTMRPCRFESGPRHVAFYRNQSHGLAALHHPHPASRAPAPSATTSDSSARRSLTND